MTYAEQFEQELRAWLGRSLYVWGGNGKLVTEFEDDAAFESWVRRREVKDSSHTKEENVQRVLTLYRTLRNKGVENIICGDCSGFVFYCLQQIGLDKGDMSAATMYGNCTAITKDALQAGDLVFHHNGTKITHVGVYLGETTEIESIGRDSGVVLKSLNRKTSSGALYWNRFGAWPGIREVAETKSEVEGVKNLTQTGYVLVDKINVYCNVRSGPSTSYTKIGKAYKGDDYPLFAKVSETGTSWEWWKINYDGTVGYIRTDLASLASSSSAAVSPGNGDTMHVTGGSVNIRVGPGTEYERITTLQEGDIYPFLGTATDSDGDPWIKFEYEDQEAYISGAYAEVI